LEQAVTFKVLDEDGWHIAYFNDIDHVIRSMLAHPKSAYHRIH
jgi:hypothetical protein